MVSYPFGNDMMNSCADAASAAATISFIEAFAPEIACGRPAAMLSAIEASNKSGSCETMPMLARSLSIRRFRMSMPSRVMVPRVGS